MNRVKKILSIFLCLLTFVNTLLTTISITASAEEKISAKITRDHYIAGYYFNFTSADGFRCGRHYGQPSVWKADKKYVYCVELGVSVKNIIDKTVSFTDDYKKLDSTQRLNLRLALTYGYRGTTRYGGSADAEYYATQIICWAISEGVLNRTTEFNKLVNASLKGTSGDNSKIREIVGKIKTQINDHRTKPSFTDTQEKATTYNLVYDADTESYTRTLTDNNKVAQYYQFTTPNKNVDISKSGNKVTISTTKASLATVTITAERIKSEYLTAAQYTNVKGYYYTDGANNGKSGIQDLIVDNGKLTNPTGYVKVEPRAGNITITKTSTDKQIANVKFKVTNSNIGYTKTFHTDANGKITIKDIPTGTYTVAEVNTGSQYNAVATQSKSVTKDATTTYSFKNTEKPRTLKIIKTSEDGLIADWYFSIKGTDYLGNNVNITNIKTKANGVILLSGTGADTFRPPKKGTKYTVTEEGRYEDGVFKTPAELGYIGDFTKYISFNYGENPKVKFRNTKTASLQIIKTAEDDKVEGIEFKITDTNGNAIKDKNGNKIGTVKTNADGFIEVKNLPTGKYIITEINVPNRYQTPASQTVDFTDGTVVTVHFENPFKNSYLKVYKSAEDGQIEDVLFNISGTDKLGNEVNINVFTDEDGLISETLKAGTYTITELAVADRYVASAPQTVKIDYGETKTVNFENILKKGIARFKKVDSETGKEIKVKDAEFELYEYNTDEGGYVLSDKTTSYNADTGYYTTEKLPITLENQGKYKVAEKTAPTGYVLSDEEYEFTITENEQVIDLNNGTIPNTPQKAHIDIYKVDEDVATDVEDTNTVNLLPNAVFGIYAKEDITANGDLMFTAGTLVDTVTTNETTPAETKELYLGKYYVKEIKAPYGYVLDTTAHDVELTYQGQNIDVFHKYLTVSDKSQKGQIEIIKTDAETNKPLANAEYEIYAKEDIIVGNVLKHEKGALLDTVKTDADGKNTSVLLYLGKYEIKESKAPYGYVIDNTVYDVELTYQGQEIEVFTHSLPVKDTPQKARIELLKTDVETNKPLANAEFGIYAYADIIVNGETKVTAGTLADTVKTDADGKATSKELYLGEYLVKELTAPKDYVLSAEEHIVTLEYKGQEVEIYSTSLEVTDNVQKGIIAIQKQGEVLTDVEKTESDYGEILTPIYAKRNLADAEYEIYADEDIIVNGETKVTAGTLVDTVKTAENEPVSSKQLYLGKYKVVEKTAPNGFVLNNTAYSVELTYQGQEISVFTENLVIENERQKVSVSFNKTMEENIYYPNANKYKEVLFGIYVRKDIISNGETVITANSLVDVITLNADGKGISNADLPTGKYYLKEIKTAKGYVLLDKEFDFEFKYSNQNEVLQEIKINDTYGEIVNEVIKGYVAIKKTSSLDGRALADAEYGIYRKSDDKYIASLITDENGCATSEILPYGEYYLKEIKAPTHFKVNENVYNFFIGGDTEEPQTITLSVEDEPIIGKLKVSYTEEQGSTDKFEFNSDIKSPVTSDDTDGLTATFIIMILSAVLCIITAYKRKRGLTNEK